MHVQVLRLQSTSASPNSPPVDHASGIEAMVLAILQQANYSQQLQLGAIAGMVFQIAEDGGVQQGLLLDALAKLLADAQTSNAMVQARLGGIKSAPSLIPASHSLAACMQRCMCEDNALLLLGQSIHRADVSCFLTTLIKFPTALINHSSADSEAALTERHIKLHTTTHKTSFRL